MRMRKTPSKKNDRQIRLTFSMRLLRLLFIIVFSAFLFAPFVGWTSSDIDFLEKSYGENNPLAPTILVAYATRAGSTAEVADAIGKKLAQKGAMVDVKHLKNVQTLNGYQAVVLGSAIRRGAVLPEVMDFIKTYKEELRKLPVACFIVCMILRENTEENRKKAASYLDPLRAEVALLYTGMFAGKLDYSKLNFVDAFVVEHIIGTPEGDLRDWQKINNWAENLSSKLIKF